MASPPAGKSKKSHSNARKSVEARNPRKARPGQGRKPVTSRVKLPIALKFAALIAILVVGVMAWQTRTAIRLAGEHLEKRINESGMTIVTNMALMIDPRWIVDDGSHQNDVDRLLHKVQSGGPGNILHIIVYNAQHEAIALTSGRYMSEPIQVDYAPARQAGVEITKRSTSGVAVRGFLGPVRGDPSLLDGEATSGNTDFNDSEDASPAARDVTLGYVEVFLSAEDISKSKDALSSQLTRVSLLACLSAAAASFLLGRFLTSSIRTLAKDMKHVSQGDLEHQSSVDSGDELGDLGRAFNLMTTNLQAAQDAKLAQKAMEHELSVATKIQARLLPSEVPRFKGLDLAVHYISAKEVGGDYYDFIPIDTHHLGMVVADVSGKGVPGSLVMTMTRSLLRMAAAGQISPEEVVLQVNRCLAPDMSPGMFVTLVYLIVDATTREIRLVRAGHNAPLLYSGRHRKLVQLHPRGVAIGLDNRGSLFQTELETKRFRLHPGDVLVTFTDGVVEGKNPAGRDFGDEKLSRLIAAHHHQNAQQIVDAIINELEEHQKGVERSDDTTLMVVKAS